MGEVLEFEEYVRTRQDALLRSARRLVPDPVDAQDLFLSSLRNSTLLAVGSATVVMLLTAVIAWLIYKSRMRGSKALEFTMVSNLSLLDDEDVMDGRMDTKPVERKMAAERTASAA